MKSVYLPAIALVLAAVLCTPWQRSSFADSTRVGDEAAIKDVIERTYVDGLWRKRDPDIMREGFDDTFVMQVYWDGKLTSRTFEQWLDKMKPDKTPSDEEVRGEVTVLDITGVAAVARLDFYQESKHTYTDYFGLYRTDDGWKIVTKHFHAHGYEGHER